MTVLEEFIAAGVVATVLIRSLCGRCAYKFDKTAKLSEEPPLEEKTDDGARSDEPKLSEPQQRKPALAEPTHNESRLETPLPQAEPCRGIIIVDTSVLFKSAADLPSNFHLSPERQERLLDAITFLGKNGYEIWVPEMVAIEAGRVLRDGESLMSYFSSNARKITPVLAHYFKENTRSHTRPEGAVCIIPPDDNDQSLYACYARRLWWIHNSDFLDCEKRTWIIEEHTSVPTLIE